MSLPDSAHGVRFASSRKVLRWVLIGLGIAVVVAAALLLAFNAGSHWTANQYRAQLGASTGLGAPEAPNDLEPEPLPQPSPEALQQAQSELDALNADFGTGQRELLSAAV